MKKEQFKQFVSDLDLPDDEWLVLNEVDSIVLKNGKGYYSNWKHIRFKISDNSISIQHGNSEPYGCRLGNIFSLSLNQMQLSFPVGAVLSEDINKFRLPKSGDILRINNKINNTISYAIISKTITAANKFVIYLSNPINISNNTLLSFYDPTEYNENNCIHSDIIEGVYMKFSPNKGKNTKIGVKHDIIKIKDIYEIKLKLINRKIYSIKGNK